MMLNKKQLAKDLIAVWENSAGSIYNKLEVEEILIIRHYFSSAEAVTRMRSFEYDAFLFGNVTGGTGTKSLSRSTWREESK